MRPYILAETNWKHLKDEKIELAILPWGATEAHNYHLPYATDNIQAEHAAIASAKVAWDNGAKPFGNAFHLLAYSYVGGVVANPEHD